MALINIKYCNASKNLNFTVQYNNVTHTVTLIQTLAGTCTPKVFDNQLLYTDTTSDPTMTYEVRSSNSSPYAKVVSYPVIPCTINIDSVTPTNSTSPTSNDGSVVVVATGNGTKTYSLVNSVGFYRFSSTGVFTNLPPDTYTAYVSNFTGGSTCVDSQADIAVNYNTISCDLALGQINQTQSPGGTITVVNYTTIYGLEVEYRLDAGAWQSSNIFTGLAAATYSVQIRFKLFPACTASRNVTISAAPPCTLDILAPVVTHEQNKYGDDGAIQIEATTGTGPLEYSKDNGASYQSSKFFYDLAPGTYVIKVRDGASCTLTQNVTVLKYKAAFVATPIAGGGRGVMVSGPGVIAGAPQNFDNTLFCDMRFPGIEPCCFYNKMLLTDVITLQFRSSYTYNQVGVYSLLNVLQGSLLTPAKRTSNMNKSDSRAAIFSNAGANQTQIFFSTGLPDLYEIGMDVTISGQATLNGTYEIVDIRLGTGTAVGYSVLIVNKTWTSVSDPLTGTLDTVYDLESYEVYEVTIDWLAYGAGQYFIKFTGTDPQFAPYEFHTEPYETSDTLDGYVKLVWSNVDNAFGIDYNTGIEHLMRVEGRLVLIPPGGESEVMEDSEYRQIKLRENVTRLVQLTVIDVPPYIAEKMRIAFAHDYFAVDDVEYQTDEKITFEPIDFDPFVNVEIKLRQVDFLADNSDDGGDVDRTVLEVGDGEILQIEP